MSSGYAPIQAWIIKWEDIKKIVPEAANAFEAAIDDEDIDDYCRRASRGDVVDSQLKSFALLKKEFELATSVGRRGFLSISRVYHDSDDGGPYDDDLDGGFFYVHGVKSLTPAGRKFEKHLTDAVWTEYG